MDTVRTARLITPPEAEDQAQGILACDPGHTTGLAGWWPNWGLQVFEVGPDNWWQMPAELWEYRRLAVEAFAAYGARDRKSLEAVRTGGLIEGLLLSWDAETREVEVRRPRPTERIPKMATATRMLQGTELAHSQHAKDALAHLLVQLQVWKP